MNHFKNTCHLLILVLTSLTVQSENNEVLRQKSSERINQFIGLNQLNKDFKTTKHNGDTPDNIFLFESFEDGEFPADWVRFDLDGNTPNPNPIVTDFTEAWNVRSAFNSFGYSLQSTSYYIQAAQADDWVITKRVTIQDNTRLRWEAFTDVTFPDGYEVYISTTTQDIKGCMANPLLFSIDAEMGSLTQRTVNLAELGYQNQDIYICYRNNTFNGFVLEIDDIQIFKPFNNDLTIISASRPSEYTISAAAAGNKHLTLEAEVLNDGSLTQENYSVTAFIIKDNQLFDELTVEVPTPLLADESILVQLPDYEVSDEGEYAVLFRVVSALGADENINNDSFYMDNVLVVDSNIMARDNGFAYDDLGINSDFGGYLGHTITVEKPTILEKISFNFTSICQNSCPLVGLEFNAAVLSFDDNNNIPGELLGETQTYAIPQQDIFAEEIILDLPTPITLQPGKYLLAIEQPVGPNQTIFIGTSMDKLTPRESWISFTIEGEANWDNFEFYGIEETLMIRGYFAEADLPDVIFSNGFD